MKAKRSRKSKRVASNDELGAIEPGYYTLVLWGRQDEVKVWDAIPGQWPDNKEVRMVQFLTDPVRFHRPLEDVLRNGGIFTPTRCTPNAPLSRAGHGNNRKRCAVSPRRPRTQC